MKGTVIHYSVTPPRSDHRGCQAQWDGIRRYHLSQGYKDVAYGWGVCQHGGVFEGRGWGPNAANGSAQLNRDYHSICWLGDQTVDPSDEALRSISWLLDVGPDARREVLGHRDVHATSCPGDALEAWVQAGATVAPAPPLPAPPIPVGGKDMIVGYQSGNKGFYALVDGVKVGPIDHEDYKRVLAAPGAVNLGVMTDGFDDVVAADRSA